MISSKTLRYTLALLLVGNAPFIGGVAHAPIDMQSAPVVGPPVPVSTPPAPTSRGDMEIVPTWTITEYTAGYESTQKHPGEPGYGIAANGQPIKEGECACDQRYKFGTVFDVGGLGRLVCTDRGGAVAGNHLDVYTPNLQDALDFGRQQREVKVIER